MVEQNAIGPANIAGKSLILGNITATPTQEGKVKLETKEGQTKIIEVEEFKDFLIKNAPKIEKGDTIQFSGKHANQDYGYAENPYEAKESKSVLAPLLVLGGLTGLAIWQRKNLMEYGKKGFEIACDYSKKAVEWAKGLVGKKAEAEVVS